MSQETAGTPTGLTAWDDDTALMGPKAPKWNGQIEHLIRYLLTVHKRFGNTAVTADLKWGASALWKRDEQKERIELLEKEVAALTTQRDELQRALAHFVACVKSDPEMMFYHGNDLCERFKDVIPALAAKSTEQGGKS